MNKPFRKRTTMELMVNATIRRYMKERRPVYVRWKGRWYTGEVLRCGPAYLYKIKSIVNREIYLLERSKIKPLEKSSTDNDHLQPGTDIAYFNQINEQWEQGIVIAHNSSGYAQVRWKMSGRSEEFVNWFEAGSVSTTPPNISSQSSKLVKPAAGLFVPQDDNSSGDENSKEVDSSLLQNNQTRTRKWSHNLHMLQPKSSNKPSIFGKLRSKQPPPKSSQFSKAKETVVHKKQPPVVQPPVVQPPVVEELTIEQIDPLHNPSPPKFAGIPPKWLAPTPVYYPYPMYVPVPVLTPRFPLRPPSVSYPFFPGQTFEQGPVRTNHKGIPPYKGSVALFRLVPKHQSKLMTKQPFSFSGRKLSSYEPRSVELERRCEYLPPYEAIVPSRFRPTTNRKARDSKRYAKLSSTSDSLSEEDEVLQRPASTESARSHEQTKPLHPNSVNSGTKVRRRASTELTKSFILKKRLSDLPSSSPTVNESEIPIIVIEPSSDHVSAMSHDMRKADGKLSMRDDGDDSPSDVGLPPIISSDSGVRTDTGAYSTQPGDCLSTEDDDKSSTTLPLCNTTTTVSTGIPNIVVEDVEMKQEDTSDSEVLALGNKFTSENKFNPSYASVEQYLFGSQQLSDTEHPLTLQRDLKSTTGSATDLRSHTLASFSSLSFSTELLGDTSTCRSKRRLRYAVSSEPETKQSSSDSESDDESRVINSGRPDNLRFNAVLSTADEIPEESLPGNLLTRSSSSPQPSSNRMSAFLKSLSPTRLITFKPKKRVTFNT